MAFQFWQTAGPMIRVILREMLHQLLVTFRIYLVTDSRNNIQSF